jgi:cell shape-determining protein MreC
MKKKYLQLNPKKATVIILIAIFLALFVSTFLEDFNLKSKPRDVSAGIMKQAWSIKSTFERIRLFVSNKNNLIDEISSRETRNKELEAKVISLESEIKNLKKYGVATNESRPLGKSALVLSQSPSSPYDTLIVAAGIQDGVQVGFKAVAFGSILLGEVERAGERTSNIKLLSYPGLEREAWLEDRSLNILLKGMGGSNLKFSVPKGLEVKIGERIISNSRPIFLIGQVEYIRERPSEPLKEVILRTPLNLRHLRFVELLP